MFTYNYSQPSEYRFSLDSIHLAEFVAQQLLQRTDLDTLRVLDLCAGCGVVGIELTWYVRAIKQIDFIEIQDIYSDYFQQNVTNVNRPELQLRWHLLNYDALLNESWQEKFDLIVSNPPYFQAGHGVLSPSTFKNRCRFYLDSSFENFIYALANTLAAGGEAYFLLRPLTPHQCDLFSVAQKLLGHTSITLTKIAKVRGNDVILMKKSMAVSHD